MANYPKNKGRSISGRFAAIPNTVLQHENFIRLNPRAVKLFIDMLYQYNGNNNGDLTACWTIMKDRGWKSKETLRLALHELLHYGWLICTRIGGLNKSASLYAVTFKAIDDCGGKIDCKPTKTPTNEWKDIVDIWVKPQTYKEIDRRRQAKLENKSSVRNPYRSSTESVPLTCVAGTESVPAKYGIRS